jgi:hypothetical protein
MSEVIDLSDGFSGDEEVGIEKDPESELERVDLQMKEVRSLHKFFFSWRATHHSIASTDGTITQQASLSAGSLRPRTHAEPFVTYKLREKAVCIILCKRYSTTPHTQQLLKDQSSNYPPKQRNCTYASAKIPTATLNCQHTPTYFQTLPIPKVSA